MIDPVVILVIAGAVLLLVSALLVLYRIIRGPSVLDRTVAAEVLVSILVCAFGLEAAINRNSTTLPILVSLALFGFVGSVAVARFVALDHDRGSDDASSASFLNRDGAESVTPSGTKTSEDEPAQQSREAHPGRDRSLRHVGRRNSQGRDHHV